MKLKDALIETIDIFHMKLKYTVYGTIDIFLSNFLQGARKDAIYGTLKKRSMKYFPPPFREFYFDYHVGYRCVDCNPHHECWVKREDPSYLDWERIEFPPLPK